MNIEVQHPRQELMLDLDSVDLPAVLTLPTGALGLALFAQPHGGGAAAYRRQRHVARILERAGVGTLLCDLGAGGDERVHSDPELLARRFLAVARWAASEASAVPLPLGYLGVGTGAAAAFIAAASEPRLVAAIVARGGGPELVGPWLPAVRAATLFMVGADDPQGLALAHEAAVRLHGPRRLALVRGAGRNFEEPGTLDHAAHLASAWFIQFFAQVAPPRAARPRWQHIARARG